MVSTRIIKPSFESIDERGSLREIVSFGEWRTVNLSTRKKGSILGNHYHKHINELIFIISGEVEVKIENISTSAVETFRVKQNEGFLVHPFEKHTITALEDVIFVNLLSEKFDSSSPDLFK